MALMDRVKRVLLRPKQEWGRIKEQRTSVGQLYTGYIIPLAAIGPIATIIGWSVVGLHVPSGGSIRSPLGSTARAALISYGVTLVGVYVLAVIVDALAPTFGGRDSRVQALKTVAYSCTGIWIAGVFLVLPMLWYLVLLGGLYSCYLLYVGLPVVMRSRKNKTAMYSLVVILAGIVLFAVNAAVARPPMGGLAGP